MAENMPKKEKKQETIKKPEKVIVDEIVLSKVQQDKLVDNFKQAAVDGIKDATKIASELKNFEAVEINTDLKKDGKYPHCLVFVSRGEQRAHIEAEMPDGVVRKHSVDIFPQSMDIFGVEYKHYEMKKYGISHLFAFPTKRIISCTAEKIYALYI